MTPQPTPPLCPLCKERSIQQGVKTPVKACDECFEKAEAQSVREYRAALRLVQGGLPA